MLNVVCKTQEIPQGMPSSIELAVTNLSRERCFLRKIVLSGAVQGTDEDLPSLIAIISGDSVTIPVQALGRQAGTKRLCQVQVVGYNEQSDLQSVPMTFFLNIGPAPAATPALQRRVLFVAADPGVMYKKAWTEGDRYVPGLDLQRELGLLMAEIAHSLAHEGEDHAARAAMPWKVKSVQASDLETLARSLLQFRPQIVHFAGHALQGAIVLQDRQEVVLASADGLAGVFGACAEHLQLVILNACRTNEMAATISKRVQYVIGMEQVVSDEAAKSFSRAFYMKLANDGAKQLGDDEVRAACLWATDLLRAQNRREAAAPSLFIDGQLQA